MRKTIPWMLAAILTLCGTGLQAQTKRSDDFRARYELKEVVVMSRHNIRSPLTSGAAYQRVTPHSQVFLGRIPAFRQCGDYP